MRTAPDTHAMLLTLIRDPAERPLARLLIESLRAFGGDLGQATVWLFEADPVGAPCADLASPGVEIVPLTVPASVRGYWFGAKVAACARAEEMAPAATSSLVWFDPTCLVVQPPALLSLGATHDAAVRPVHHRNVGSPAGQALDPFWRGVYRALGIDDVETAVSTFIENEPIRPYFNSHGFAVNPSLGLMARWLERFEALVLNERYQATACGDVLHQVFLHQAVWSTLLATEIAPDRLRLLPPTYNYPYNLHAEVPPGSRPAALNDLVCLTYEERTLDPSVVADIAIEEPLRAWLVDRIGAPHA